MVVIVAVFVLMYLSAIATAGAAETDGNVCVPDVKDQFENLKHHGEALGFSYGVGEDPGLSHDHYQGIARFNDPDDGTPYLFFTTGPDDDDEGADLLVVKMASRNKTGERLRSNRLQKGKETEDTTPPSGDRGVKVIHFDGSPLPAFDHAGGVQCVGDILAVALEDTDSDNGTFVLFDVSEPEKPILIYTKNLSHKAGTIGITKRPSDGHYIVVVGGIFDGRLLTFFESNTPDLRADGLKFNLIDTWYKSELDDESDWHYGTVGFQTLNFVRQCVDNRLFLIGTRNTQPSPVTGNDWVDLFEVTYTGTGENTEFTLSFVTNKHMYCNFDGSGRICNFAAASGVYVSPSSELILYASEHENDGPDGTVRMAEFRHRDVNRLGTSTSGTAWAELYDDDHFKDRSIVFDWVDRDKDDFENFNKLDGFNDKTSSVRWSAPKGCEIILYEHDSYDGDKLVLSGNGYTKSYSDLDDYEFGDKTSSVKFRGTCDNKPPIANANGPYTISEGSSVQLNGSASYDPDNDPLTYQWDFNGDGNYNDATGSQPTFSAATLDGPSVITVSLLVSDNWEGSDTSNTTVTVNNVAPTASIDSIEQPNPHFILPHHLLTFNGSFTDPGWLDTHTATWDFDDGTVVAGTLTEENEQPDSTGTSTADHAYSEPGDYMVTLIVTDDDGGIGTDTSTVTIKSAEEAIPVMDDYIQDLPDDAFKNNPDQRKNAFSEKLAEVIELIDAGEYQEAIDKLQHDIRAKADGYVDGHPKNDWITDPEAQEEICTMIDDLIAYLETLL